MRHATSIIALSLIACSSTADPDDSKENQGSTVTTGSTNASNATTGNTGSSGVTTGGGGMNPVGAGGSGGSSGVPCAEPGAMGNELGVGTYCQTDADCSGLDASFCTVAHEPSAPPFCTKPCFSAGECGADATCEDNGGPLKGCVPGCLT